MDIRIGILNSPREIAFSSNQGAAEIEKIVADALESERRFVSFADEKGNTYIVHTSSLAYVEVGAEEQRRVGFVA